MGTMATKTIFTGFTTAWIRKVDDADGSVALSTPILKFDNISSGSLTIKAPADAASGGTTDNVEIQRGDGATIQYNKPSLILDGATDSVKSSGTSSGGTVKDEIKFTVNEADMDSATWTEFLIKLKGLLGEKLLICMPLGYTYGKITDSTAANVKPDGYAFMVGKLSGDIAQALAGNTPSSLELTFTGCDVSYTDDAQADTAFATHGFVSISVKGRTSVTVTPTAMGATDGHLLVAGRIHLIEHA